LEKLLKEALIIRIMQKSIMRAAVGTGLVLLIPLILQLTIGTGVDGQGFNWKPGDFIVMGALIFITGLVIDFAMRKFANPTNRAVAIVATVIVFLLIWVHLAVGIVDTWPLAGS
jgi:hypothetical protein